MITDLRSPPMTTDQKTPGQLRDEIGPPMPALPPPDCTYADHSYPAYSRKKVLEILAHDRANQPAASGVPDGWRLVPIEPTGAMLDAAARASMQHLIDCIRDPDPAKQREIGSEAMTRKTHAARYMTMLAAAPEAPKP